MHQRATRTRSTWGSSVPLEVVPLEELARLIFSDSKSITEILYCKLGHGVEKMQTFTRYVEQKVLLSCIMGDVGSSFCLIFYLTHNRE